MTSTSLTVARVYCCTACYFPNGYMYEALQERLRRPRLFDFRQESVGCQRVVARAKELAEYSLALGPLNITYGPIWGTGDSPSPVLFALSHCVRSRRSARWLRVGSAPNFLLTSSWWRC